MTHRLSEADKAFRDAFEAGRIAPGSFDHRSHLRLAYAYLVEHDVEEAHVLVRDGLLRFLLSVGAPVSKYHETITRAWILAVRHFMQRGPGSASAEEFLERNPELLDARIMRTHYSAERLFSEEARARYLAPDRDPIPREEDPSSR